MQTKNFQSFLFIIIGYSFLSFSDATFKWLNNTDMPLLITVFYGSALSLLSLTAVVICIRKSQSLYQTDGIKWHMVRAIVQPILFFLTLIAFASLQLPFVYAILFTAPFLTVLAARIVFSEKVSVQQIILIGMAFLGVLIILRPTLEVFSLPILAALAAPFFITIMSISSRKLAAYRNGLFTFAFYPLVGMVITSFVLSIMIEGVEAFKIEYPYIIFQLAAGWFFMIGLMYVGLGFNLGEPSKVAPFQYIQMLWGIWIGFFVFKTVPDIWTMIGAAIIIFAGLALMKHIKRDKMDPTPHYKTPKKE